MFLRQCGGGIREAMLDSPVVVVCGSRQCGKTTLVQKIKKKNWRYITLDDQTQLELARKDPVGFIRNIKAPHIIIDEVHRVPELFLSIKQAVDEKREYGKFLLTGSANVLSLPKIADSLAGRMEIITLMPLAECEIRNRKSTFFDKILSDKTPTAKETRIRDDLIVKIISGGFPEPLKRQSHTRKMAWHNQYVNSIAQKDVVDIQHVEYLSEIPKLIGLLSNQVGKLTNYTELASSIGLSRNTMIKYISILEKLGTVQKRGVLPYRSAQ
jgi:predicted AAA+ superfamily ATPase